MKLNPDCIRAILFTVEETITFGTFMGYPTDSVKYPHLSAYSQDEVLYHIKQCELSGLLTKVDWLLSPGCLIHDLSPAGHEFLANIRSDTNWNKTKEIAGKVGSTSLSALCQIAGTVISNLINRQP